MAPCEAWALLLKSVTSKKPSAPAAPPDDPGNPTVNFHSDWYTNVTHQSTTDPEARLTHKSADTEAKLSFSGHVLMENRHRLCVDLLLATATGTAERAPCGPCCAARPDEGFAPRRWARKGYHCRNFCGSVAYGRC